MEDLNSILNSFESNEISKEEAVEYIKGLGIDVIRKHLKAARLSYEKLPASESTLAEILLLINSSSS